MQPFPSCGGVDGEAGRGGHFATLAGALGRGDVIGTQETTPPLRGTPPGEGNLTRGLRNAPPVEGNR